MKGTENRRPETSEKRLRSCAYAAVLSSKKTSLSIGVCDVFYSFWTLVFLWISEESVGAALDAGNVYKKF